MNWKRRSQIGWRQVKNDVEWEGCHRIQGKDALKEALKDDEDESIVRDERNGDDGSIDVHFAKRYGRHMDVQLYLNGDENLFGGKIAVELFVF